MSARRPKDRSHWGDAAFKAMHEKPITREVLHKALQEPTARELLAEWKSHTMQPATLRCVEQLAARVEAVLALHSQRSSSGSCAECLGGHSELPCPTVRLLDGMKP